MLRRGAGREPAEPAPRPRVSIVIPARDEAEAVTAVLAGLARSVRHPAEVLVVVDTPADPTVAAVRACVRAELPVRCLVSAYPGGPAGAIRWGFENARAPVVVVTMADGSDDASQIDELADLVEAGAVVAAASRYARGGRQVGAPLVKRSLSWLAGRSLQALARPGTCDPTNSFKAYSAEFARCAEIESRRGFTIGIELTAKARRMRLPVTEVPTTWRERGSGRSHFRLIRWLPGYLRWYLYCFGGSLTDPRPEGTGA